MVKHDNKWGTVCDDDFEAVDAQAACKTLGYRGGSFQTFVSGLDNSRVPTWMDNVNCASSSTNFLKCSHPGWGKENCSHNEDVLLTCS